MNLCQSFENRAKKISAAMAGVLLSSCSTIPFENPIGPTIEKNIGESHSGLFQCKYDPDGVDEPRVIFEIKDVRNGSITHSKEFTRLVYKDHEYERIQDVFNNPFFQVEIQFISPEMPQDANFKPPEYDRICFS